MGRSGGSRDGMGWGREKRKGRGEGEGREGAAQSREQSSEEEAINVDSSFQGLALDAPRSAGTAQGGKTRAGTEGNPQEGAAGTEGKPEQGAAGTFPMPGGQADVQAPRTIQLKVTAKGTELPLGAVPAPQTPGQEGIAKVGMQLFGRKFPSSPPREPPAVLGASPAWHSHPNTCWGFLVLPTPPSQPGLLPPSIQQGFVDLQSRLGADGGRLGAP